MKKVFTLVLACFSVFGAYAQCSSTYVVDSASLSPASNYPTGGFSPRPLPVITQGVFYEQDVSFVMPKEYDSGIIGIVDIDQIYVSSITNLPAGLTWSCNVSGCTYYPQTNQYGAVKICGTTFASPKIDSVKVTVIGTAVGQQAPIEFYLGFEIVPNPVSSGSFTVSSTIGCDSVVADFAALIGGNGSPISYNWDFGNGNTSSDSLPPRQVYDSAGTYQVILETVISEYILDSISVTGINGGWTETLIECPSGSLPPCANSAPDLFVEVYDNGSNLIYTSGVVSDQMPVVRYTNFNGGAGINFNAPPYIIRVWDEDFTGNPNDDLGSFAITNFNVGNNTRSGNGTSISFHIRTQPILTEVDTVEINVFASPAQPTMVNLTGDTTGCAGDTIWLTGSPGDSYTWYRNGSEITGADDSTLAVTATGNYAVQVTSSNSCASPLSATDSITINPLLPVPSISYQASLDRLAASFMPGVDMQWYLDGSVIPNANSITYDNPAAGVYTVVFTKGGCSTSSPEFIFTGVDDINMWVQASITPNPNNGNFVFNLQSGSTGEAAVIKITDVIGRQIYSETLASLPASLSCPISINVPAGIYLLNIHSGQSARTIKFVVH